MSLDWQPLLTTFKLAAITSFLLLVIGVPLAYWLAKTQSKIGSVAEALLAMPLVLPPSVLGFYLLILFSPKYFLGSFLEQTFDVRIVFSFSGLVIGSILFSLPFMVNPIVSALKTLPKNLAEASYTLGKSVLVTFLRVELPNIKSGLLVGVVLSFAHTIGEFGVVLMIGGSIPGETKLASIAIYEAVESMDYASANLYAMILFGICFSILLSIYLINKKALRPF